MDGVRCVVAAVGVRHGVVVAAADANVVFCDYHCCDCSCMGHGCPLVCIL